MKDPSRSEISITSPTRSSTSTKAATSEDGKTERKHRLCCSYRLLIAAASLVSFYNATYIRFGVVIAMVCMTNSTVRNTSSDDPECPPLEEEARGSSLYEFHWTNELRGLLLSGAFYGFLVGPFVSGFLSFKFGGKIILVVGHLFAGITHALIPELTRLSPYLFFTLRIFSGIFGGFLFPATQDILSHWVIPEERQLLVGGALVGVPMSSVITFPLNGLLCSELGWVWIFYFSAVWLSILSVFIYFFVFDDPQLCPYASQQERVFVTAKTPAKVKGLKVPWNKIMKCIPVYAYLITHFCVNYGFLTIIMSLPLFMREVHHFSLTSNSFLSSTPYLAALVCRVLLTFTFDLAKKKLNVSTNYLRKTNVLIGLTIPSLALIAVSQIPCKYRYVSLACFIIFSAALEFSISGGYLLSLLDMCPSYNNILSGFANAIANSAGLLSATLTGVLTPNGTHEEWNSVFYISIAFFVVGAFTYVVFGTSELQPWGLAPRPKVNDDPKKYSSISVSFP